MDRSFTSGAQIEPRPVHPPRGERGRQRRGGGFEATNEPLECSGGQVMRANQRLLVTGPTAVIVRDGCRLSLVNVDLEAQGGVVLEGGSLEMVGGSITAEGVAVRAGGEAAVTLENVAIEAATALEAADEARVTITDGRLSASGAAVVARGQAQVVLRGVEVDGPIAQDDSAKVTVADRADGPGDPGGDGGE